LKKNKQKVWDLPVRLLHWSLVLTVAMSWLTSSRTGPAHEYWGYGAGAIVCARLLWGFVGSRHARFAQFLRGIRPTLQYARAVVAQRAPRYLGHNPLGGWMVLALLACLVALTFTGWLATTDMFWGYAWLVQLHEAMGWTLLGLITLHVAGVLFTSWQHRENLIAAILSGYKHPDE
jgi:cytochrome b